MAVTARLGPCNSGVQGGCAQPPLQGRSRAGSQSTTTPFPKAGHHPPTPAPALLPPRPSGGPAAYSKSPSRYLPKACRTTVLTAMSGFTTQNCRVAWWGRRSRVGAEQRKPGDKHLLRPAGPVLDAGGAGRGTPRSAPRELLSGGGDGFCGRTAVQCSCASGQTDVRKEGRRKEGQPLEGHRSTGQEGPAERAPQKQGQKECTRKTRRTGRASISYGDWEAESRHRQGGRHW